MRARQSATTASQVTSPDDVARTISVAVSSFSADVPAGRGLACVAVLMTRSIPGASGAGAGDPAEYRAGGEPRSARIVEIEQSAHEFAGGVEATDRLVVGIEHLAVGVDAHAAERERYAAGDGVAF